jgi:hypothetical protein
VVPVVLLHDQGEARRFEAVFADQSTAAIDPETDSSREASPDATSSLVATH